jgi:hypothetical protein
VAEHPLTDEKRNEIVAALRATEDVMTPFEDLLWARMPRAPPGLVRVWDGDFPVPGVVAFGWEERGVVVIDRATAQRIAARYARDPEAVQAWWDRLLAHELEFHLGAEPEHTGHRHDTDAAAIARDWFGWTASSVRPGLRKPHGSELARELGGLLTGEEMSMIDRRSLADRLEQRVGRTTPPEAAPGESELLYEMVRATVRLLRAWRLGEWWREVGPVRLNWLDDATAENLTDPMLGSTADAGYVERDGVLDIYARDELGVLYGVVGSVLAPAFGFGPDESHLLAVLTERLVDGPDHPGEAWKPRPGWLTARAERELRALAVHNPPARALLVGDRRRVRAELSARFAGLPEWRDLALRYVEEFHAAAIEAARLPELDEGLLRAEYATALSGLRQLAAGARGLSKVQRTMVTRRLSQAERDAGGPARWEIAVELRSLRAAAERAGVWATDAELVDLAVRNVTWGRHTAAPELAGVRELATDALIGTASPELAPLLRPDLVHGTQPLIRAVVPAWREQERVPPLEGAGWAAIRARRPHLFAAARVPLGSLFESGSAAPVPSARELDADTRGRWITELTQEVPPVVGFVQHFATLRAYVDDTVAMLRGTPRRSDRPTPPVRFHVLETPIVDELGRAADALARWEIVGTRPEILDVYATDALGALHVLTEALFAVQDGFTGEQRWVIAELVERAAGRKPVIVSHRQWAGSWLAESHYEQLGARGWDEGWQLIAGHPAERDRVVALFADRPFWAPAVGHYLDQRYLAALALAPEPTTDSDDLLLRVDDAKSELDAIINGMRLPRGERREARRQLQATMDIHGLGGPGSGDVRPLIRGLAANLAVAAHRSGQQLPARELVELATRLAYWATATTPFRDPLPAGLTPADVGDPVRAALAAAFGRKLPEPLRAALELDRLHLHEVRKNLHEQRSRLLDQMANLFVDSWKA